jgi:hypothetical protein
MDKLGVELASLTQARKEATVLAGELLRDRPDAFWDVQAWRMTVQDETGLTLFVIEVDATVSPAVGDQLRHG